MIAGYPWFTDWGRDTFISLRGLCLATGRLDEARGIALAWCDALSEGMLPNRFGEGAAPEYNTVDAALWFIVAADALAATGACTDAERRALDDATDAIIAGYQRGTRHGIRVDGDGLVASGEPGVQLTWMDAKVGDWVVTPRTGKPVEIQALWASALAIASRRRPALADDAGRVRAAFAVAVLERRPRRCCSTSSTSITGPAPSTPASGPTRIFAVGGLPLALLDGDARARRGRRGRARAVDPGRAALAGARRARLPGPLRRRAARARRRLPPGHRVDLAGRAVRRGLGPGPRRHRRGPPRRPRPLPRAAARPPRRAGLGHLAEIADGDPPHAARGCPFQAWSVAEALRLDLDVLADAAARRRAQRNSRRSARSCRRSAGRG